MADSLRLFFAIELSPPLQEKVFAIRRELMKGDPDVKWVEQENLHFTLQFLGETPRENISSLMRHGIQVAAAVPSFSVTLSGVGAFPSSRRPRVLWVGIEEGKEEMKKLATLLQKRELPKGRLQAQPEEYTPHLTIGRVRTPRGSQSLVSTLEKMNLEKASLFEVNPVGVRMESLGRQHVEEFMLKESQLTRKGPVYITIERFPLGGASRD